VGAFLEKAWTQEEKENLAHLKREIIAAQKAMILIEGFGKTRKATATDGARALELLKDALDESEVVRDDVVAKLHRDVPKAFREKHVSGMMRLVKLLEANRDGQQFDAQEFATIDGLLDEWDDWANAHRKEMRFPKGVPD